MMRRSQQILLFVFAVLSTLNQEARAQVPVLGGLIEGRSYYNGTGFIDYGGYGSATDKYMGFGRPYGYYDFRDGYGSGPYGPGSGSEHEFLSTNRYSHGDAVYRGYGSIDYEPPPRPQRYNPYGYGVPNWRRHWDDLDDEDADERVLRRNRYTNSSRYPEAEK